MALFHLRHVWDKWKTITVRNAYSGSEYNLQQRECVVCGLKKRRRFR